MIEDERRSGIETKTLLYILMQRSTPRNKF